MAIKENALPVGTTSGSGTYIRTVSSGGESQKTPFDVVKGAVTEDMDVALENEVLAREDADTTLRGEISDAVAAEAAARDQAIQEAIADEVTDRNEAIASAIESEETARNTAISEAVAAEAQAREAADEELNQSKADTDGNYPDMTVGNADQLISSIYTEDQTPYNFRQSGGGFSIGDREIDKIVGGTVAWNQIVTFSQGSGTSNGITFTRNSDGTIVASGTATETAVHNLTRFNVTAGHKYLFDSGTNDSEAVITLTNSANWGGSAPIGISGIGNCVASGASSPALVVYSGTTLTNKKFVPQIFDLTAMFGSAIADYIYSLEQATAGAGVAYFRKLFPKPYYAYNAGELMSVQVASHEMVGFNQWDEEWEVYGTNGQIRSKNAIKVIEGATYYAKSSIGLSLYFKETPSGATVSSLTVNNQIFTVPKGCHYMTMYTGVGYGTTYKNDICINLSHNGSRNGEYEPYEKHSYELDANLTLRGIPKLDASNNLYYDGDEYESDGSVTRKYGVVDLGTLNWYYASGKFATSYPSMKKLTDNILCQKYTTTRRSDYLTTDKTINTTPYHYTDPEINIFDSAYTDAASFKAAMSGVYLVYELATPTEESSAPYTNPQMVSDWGTEEYVDAAVQEGDRDVAVPVGHVTDYLANLRDKLQNLPDAAGADGTYLVQQTSGQMALLAYTPGVNIPAAPTTDGTYTLQAVVSGGVATYSWVSS